MHVGLRESGRRVRFREIENAAVERRIVREGQIKNSVRGGDVQAADRRGHGDGARGIDAGRASHGVHAVDELRQRFVHVGRVALDLRELADFEHGVVSPH